jgi:hypothetical protein
VNTESLKQFRDPTQKTRKPVWRPPQWTDFRAGSVIAFDPSLSATGVVALSFDPDRGFWVHAARKLPNPDVDATGNEGNFRKALVLTEAVNQWRAYLPEAAQWPFVHEAPPVGGGRIRAPESALLASLAIRQAMLGSECLPMVTPAAHKHFICGNSKADKRAHHMALDNFVADDWDHFRQVTNEATRDALSIALYALKKD